MDSAASPGVRAPYEPPRAPELTLHGDRGSPEHSAGRIIAFIEGSGWLK